LLRLKDPLRFQRFSYRFAEQVLNSKLSLKEEMTEVVTDPSLNVRVLSRPQFNKELRDRFLKRGWIDQPPVFNLPEEPEARMDFLKERIGVEVGFRHASFIGIDLLKFQVASYSGLDKIDVGVYVVTTQFPGMHEERIQSELGGFIDFRESRALPTALQERRSGSNLRNRNRPLRSNIV
jgi:hypothetical protein